MLQFLHPVFFTILAFLFEAGGQQGHRGKYLVTSDPLRVYGRPGPGGLCIAIDPGDPTGIWWWGPGRSGCVSRDTVTGEGHENVKSVAALFHALNAVVATDSSGTVHGRFRLGLHARPGQPEFVDVNLTVESDVIRCSATQAAVQAKRLDILDVPLEPPR